MTYFCGRVLPRVVSILPSCLAGGFPDLSPAYFFALFTIGVYLLLSDVKKIYQMLQWQHPSTAPEDVGKEPLSPDDEKQSLADAPPSKRRDYGPLVVIVVFLGALQLLHIFDWDIRTSFLGLLVILLTFGYTATGCLFCFEVFLKDKVNGYWELGVCLLSSYLSIAVQVANIRNELQSSLFGQERLLPIFNIAVTCLVCLVSAHQVKVYADLQPPPNQTDKSLTLNYAQVFTLHCLLLFAIAAIVLALFLLQNTSFFWAVFFTCVVYVYTLPLRITTYAETTQTMVYAKTLGPVIVDLSLLCVVAVRAFQEKLLSYALLSGGISCTILHSVLLVAFKVQKQKSNEKNNTPPKMYGVEVIKSNKPVKRH